MSGARAAFALVRPPGHHALYDEAMGFCLVNNVAVAAHYATRKYELERVLIVDWDVHHGNGAQNLFYSRPECVILQHPPVSLLPRHRGDRGDRGRQRSGLHGKRAPPAGVGDHAYKQVFDEVLTPLARRYKPQLVLISAGYDAHVADPSAVWH